MAHGRDKSKDTMLEAAVLAVGSLARSLPCLWRHHDARHLAGAAMIISLEEAELLIALLTYLEQSLAERPYDEVEAALKDLRPFRSRLLERYLHERMAVKA